MTTDTGIASTSNLQHAVEVIKAAILQSQARAAQMINGE